MWGRSEGAGSRMPKRTPMTPRIGCLRFDDLVCEAEREMAKVRVGFEIGEQGRGGAYEF